MVLTLNVAKISLGFVGVAVISEIMKNISICQASTQCDSVGEGQTDAPSVTTGRAQSAFFSICVLSVTAIVLFLRLNCVSVL